MYSMYVFVYCMIIDDDIDGGSFIKLPSDEGKLRQELKLTRGGTDKVANLLSKIQTHQPGPELKKEKREWLNGKRVN